MVPLKVLPEFARLRGLAMRIHRTRSRAVAATLVIATGLVGVGVSGVASAQPTLHGLDGANGGGFDTHLFRPAMDSKGMFTVNGSDILGKDDVSFGLVIDYGRNLLRVADLGQKSTQLVNHSFQ